MLNSLKKNPKRPRKNYLTDEVKLVSSFMNLPSGFAQKRTSHPLSMENLVEKVWEDWGIGEEETQESIISGNWQKIVGRKLSSKCAPVSISKDGKTLQIRAASSAIKQELSFHKDKMLKSLKVLPNCAGINSIRIY